MSEHQTDADNKSRKVYVDEGEDAVVGDEGGDADVAEEADLVAKVTAATERRPTARVLEREREVKRGMSNMNESSKHSRLFC